MAVNEITQLEEDIRRDNLRALGQKLLPFVALLAVALVLGTAIKSGLGAWRTGQQEEFSRQFAVVLDESDAGKRVEALQALEKEYPKAVAAKLAGLSEVLAKGKADENLVALTDMAKDKDLPVFYRQMLVVVAARTALDADPAAARAALADLAPVIEDKASAWQLQAVFYNAIIRMRQAEDIKEIKDIVDAASKTLARDPALLKQLHQLETLYVSDRPVA